MKKRQKGHTLIEVMFAIFLVGVCALIFAGSMPMANTGRAKADRRNLATSLAQKQAEAVKAMGYVNLTPSQLYTLGLIDSETAVATNTYSFSNVDNGLVDSPALVLPSGKGRIKIETVDLDLKRVTIEVTWVEDGQTRKVELGTLIAYI